MTTKDRRVAGTSSVTLTPVRFIFDVARTTRVKARRDARHARHLALMVGGAIGRAGSLACASKRK